MPRTGTQEWSDHTKNCLKGCKNNCLYCWEKERQMRLGQILTSKEREAIKLNTNAINLYPRRLIGRIMFPSTHDLDHDHIDIITKYLRHWLAVGNEFLIVSKPQLKTIKIVCDELENYKSQITFRFTIGSKNDKILKFWEPNAPTFHDRLHALALAYDRGYKTSVSCEPFLDDELLELIPLIEPMVTDTIWVGLMNDIKRRVLNPKLNPGIDWKTGEAKEHLDMIHKVQAYDGVVLLYEYLKDNKKIRFKDSIKKMLDLPEEEVG